MSKPEDHRRRGRIRAVFAGLLPTFADPQVADGGPGAAVPAGAMPAAADAPPCAAASGDAAAMVWVHNPVNGEGLLQVPVDCRLPERWWIERPDAAQRPGEPAAVEAAAPETKEPPPVTAATVLRELARIAFAEISVSGGVKAEDKTLRVPARDKRSALVSLGRHLGLFSAPPPPTQPYAEMSDAELKARSAEIVRALVALDAEERAAEDGGGDHDGAPDPA